MLATCKAWTESTRKEDEKLYQWQTSLCSDEQNLTITKFFAPYSYGKDAVSALIKRMGKGKPHTELQRHEVDTILATLEKWLPYYDLAVIYDKGFVLLQEKFGLSSPLDLAGHDTKTSDAYLALIKSKITREHPLSKELVIKHKRAFKEMGIAA